MSLSIVEYFPEHDKSRCGYCKRTDSSFSHGMWAHRLTVDDYQNLINRGWRRSGQYCYKPKLDDTCCPLYTIKCGVLDFKLSKSQKKLLKKVNKYLCNDKISDSISSNAVDSILSEFPQSDFCDSDTHMVEKAENKSQVKIDVNSVKHISNTTNDEQERNDVKPKENTLEKKSMEMSCSQDKLNKVLGPDPNKAPCKKAKQMRIERKEEKLRLKGMDFIPRNNTQKEKNIEDLLNELADNIKNRLQIKLVRTTPTSHEWEATAAITHKLYTKYQMVVHGDSLEKCAMKHFQRFLVNSPLEAAYTLDGPEFGYGSFHQQYWLDGELIAVGVIDILPKCVSSVYFFYDPQYSHLTLGTYSALREIAFTKKLQLTTPDLQYYYMGYYIHSCPKMRYKGNYHPSFLLCPETYNWFPIENCLPKLNENPYSRLDPDLNALDTNSCEKEDLGSIFVLNGNTYMRYNEFKAKRFAKSRRLLLELEQEEPTMLEYAKLTGKQCAHRMILIKEQ